MGHQYVIDERRQAAAGAIAFIAKTCTGRREMVNNKVNGN